ncbi:MAG: hypothetical protein WC365_01415 [Candidatus Babeliales bacterium]|jgi:hypothetical protein
MKLDYGKITDEIIAEFPDLKRQEAVVFEVVKKVSLAYGCALNDCFKEKDDN